MNQIVTRGIVLRRTSYQEADRILTILTPDHGKVHALAKGVRKSKSKLAGGVELFSVSEIGFIHGRGELATLTTARLTINYSNIVQDINRTMLGYELIKLLNKVTEDAAGEEYFNLLTDAFDALDQAKINIDLINLWFRTQLLRIAGHTPNLRTDAAGNKLAQEGSYLFSYDDMAFLQKPQSPYSAGHIKFLRLVFSGNAPRTLQQVTGVESLILPCLNIVQTILPAHIRT